MTPTERPVRAGRGGHVAEVMFARTREPDDLADQGPARGAVPGDRHRRSWVSVGQSEG